ncbi:hypothetical protein PRIPAC_87763 [Pristionchus pacificus]|uniref:Uncharacterized protein n=1 Tax=Pristionchus pacificus TaxID=54126 RepID=A0A2A6CXV7_PRIPA|nr:hypothetical protein PRIPAC_87763 [Pristionchus pacificus]|eukprot:PDM82853.1 hypothetical protein PRIPAC_37246 [Pristionchus pacificus]
MTDAHMDSDSGGEDEVKQGMSAVEEAIAARKRRLMEMKSRMNGVEMKEEDYDKEETTTKKSKGQEKTFRSYQPVDASVGDVDPSVKTNLRAVEEEIEEQLRLSKHKYYYYYRLANDTSHVDKIDLQALAPKKVDWDLKRDLASKLEKLERRTQAGIAHLIRERLAEGTTNLAEVVASAH